MKSLLILLMTIALAGCESERLCSPVCGSGGADASVDAGDAGTDAGDAGTDAGDAGDAGTDAGDAG